MSTKQAHVVSMIKRLENIEHFRKRNTTAICLALAQWLPTINVLLALDVFGFVPGQELNGKAPFWKSLLNHGLERVNHFFG